MPKQIVALLTILYAASLLNTLTAANELETASLPDSVTFSRDIAPMVFNNCTTCHRPTQVAPFVLLDYQDVRKHAKTMMRVMGEGYMPPWPPIAGHGEFRGERRLSAAQVAFFKKWVDAGMPEGDSSKTPPLPKFPDGWTIGQPDMVVKMDRSFAVPAEGSDIYRNFVIPLNLTEDKWVTAVEFHASAPTVIHHVLYFLDDSGRAEKLDAGIKDGQPGFPGMGFRPTGALGGWAVGATPARLPNGLAYPLKKGSKLVLQTHLHLSGKAESETITVGLYFADKAPTQKIVRLQLPPAFGIFSRIDILAGQTDFKVTDSFTLPIDVDVFAASAHAHYLAKTMRTWATLPDGAEQKLFLIGDWNFNWQGQYLYKDYVRLPKGTVIHGEVTWDNSTANPRNPSSPPIRVRWGEGSTDEMGAVSLLMVAAKESESTELQTAIQLHTRQTVITSRRRGDEIEWERMGMETPEFWKLIPVAPRSEKP